MQSYSVRELYQLAHQLRANGEWDKAVELFSVLIKALPHVAPLYVERGMLVQDMGYPDKAMRDYEMAIKLDPQYGMGYYGRGWVRHLHGDYLGELDDARRGLLLDRDNAGMYYRRIGAAYHGLEQYTDALEWYTQSIDVYAGNDEGTIYNRGICYLEMKEYEKALADFNRSLELDPDWAWAFKARAEVFIVQENYPAAIADLTEAIKQSPHEAQYYGRRGWLFWKMEKHEAAITDYSLAIRYDPNEDSYYAKRAIVYHLMLNFPAAFDDYMIAIKLNPRNPQYYYNRGMVYQALGKTKQARADYERVYNLASGELQTWAKQKLNSLKKGWF